jgi:hypothetical protein
MLINSSQNHTIEFKTDEKSERKFVLVAPLNATFSELFDIGIALKAEAWKKMKEIQAKEEEAKAEKKEEPKVEKVKS